MGASAGQPRHQINKMNQCPTPPSPQTARVNRRPASPERQRWRQGDLERTEVVQQPRQYAHDNLHWPLPPREDGPPFQVNDNSDWDRYSLTPPSPRDTSPSPSTPRAQAYERYTERETSTEEWQKREPDSQEFDSAHIQSQLTARFHACYNLSAVDNIDVVMDGLKKNQQDLDERIKRRLAKVSEEAEEKIKLIVQDTKEEQKRLLTYDKLRQHRQDELYQEWLQKYIVELNRWRARELATLQKKLMERQEAIVHLSKRKIDRINEDANRFKTQILDEEKNAALRKSSRITGAMYDLTRRDAHFLGSESKTELNLRIQANVGEIEIGQSCQNDFVD